MTALPAQSGFHLQRRKRTVGFRHRLAKSVALRWRRLDEKHLLLLPRHLLVLGGGCNRSAIDRTAVDARAHNASTATSSPMLLHL